MNDLLIQVREVIANANTTTALVLAGIAVLAVVIIAGAALFITRMYTQRGRLDMLLEDRAPEKAANPWVARAVVILAFALTIGGAIVYAERPSSCTSCHQDPAYTEKLAESPHASVSCAACHRSSGVTAAVDDLARYGGWLWSHYMEDADIQAGTGAFVDSRRCLSCHEKVSREVVESAGIRVRHSDFLERGMTCTVCHASIGHGAPRGVQNQLVMNHCLECHNGRDASSECDLCHTKDVGIRSVAARGGKMNTVGIREVDCYGCHAERRCTSCHGMVMPHPAGFVSEDLPRGVILSVPGTGFDPGSHALEGFKNREVCFRCHFASGEPFKPNEDSCRPCHQLLGFTHGGPAWIVEHGLQATGQKPGALADCAGCHGPPERFCGWCHPPGYAERYAPVLGADNYTPSPGWPRPADPSL